MDEYVLASCPNCQRTNLKVRASYLGRIVRCKHCQHDFRVEKPRADAPPTDVDGSEKMAALRDRIQTLEKALDESSQVRNDYSGQVERLESQLSAALAVTQRVDVLEAELQSAQADADDLARRCRDAADVRERLEQQTQEHAALIAARDELEIVAQGLRRELDQHRAADAARELEFQSIRETANALVAERDRLASSHRDALLALESSSARAELMKDEARAQQSDRRQALEWLHAVETERDDLHAAVERLRVADEERAAAVVRDVIAVPGLSGWEPPGGHFSPHPPTAPMAWSSAEESEEDRRVVDLVNVAIELRNEIAQLSNDRDAWKLETEWLQRSISAAPTAASADEAGLARVSATLRRETERADALQAKLDAVHAEAIVDLAGADDDDALALSRSWDGAQTEIARLRARLSALGESPEDRGTDWVVKMF